MKFLIAAGGTGGHITPGIAIAKALKENGEEVIFIGTENGMEKDLVPNAGFDIKYIHASGLKSGLVNKLKAINDLNKGIKECIKIIEEEKPDMCIGTGGYVTAPLLMAANKIKIPSLIHESNALPGKTTSLMAKRVNEVAVGFEEAKNRLKKGNIVVTGNPNKMGLNSLTKQEAKDKIDIEGKILLIFGGSQGAKKINETILSIIDQKLFGEYTVIYATGPKHFNEIANELKRSNDKYEIEENEDEILLYKILGDINGSLTFTSSKEGINKDIKTIDSNLIDRKHPIIVKKFIYNMEEVMKASDLVICRSGALTCTEIAEVGVASILIPFPYAAENHQFFNAKTLENVNAAIIIEEKDLNTKLLIERINDIILNDEQLEEMAANSKKLKIDNPIGRIKEEIYNIVEKNKS
ncbi:MAG: UDP-N-acetylglucosamine--N-acetylmuramyl-(pentapeptide) pyrophosphoryl-undecaprenol N-acetylglucosamine transferase [Clostridia bacterium]|nr:UDP-N-acetylglucosamine--N-acetylmuramyl-(pentapeptide) pyrophosphoryl-undecaprenol N-acetylglucosamine transferase [Clostridia bacterium]